MCAYLNPRKMDKEQWLELYARPITRHEALSHDDFDCNFLVVLTSINRTHSAAAIAHDKFEREALLMPGDPRPKKYFIAHRALLLLDSDLEFHIRGKYGKANR
jgi:hypothetical protein